MVVLVHVVVQMIGDGWLKLGSFIIAHTLLVYNKVCEFGIR
jgi:hypothetical protein